MSAYYNVQVGVGPQHKEFRKEILQTMQVGVGPNIENFEKKFYRQCKLDSNICVKSILCLFSLLSSYTSSNIWHITRALATLSF
ncbi:hypothetical protein HMPREF3281_03610 [Staphylococcus sp. HMSC73A05]|nr:hypothetical protein [Staphylococcus aureus]OHS60679.1 hypothetical protein HMPREF3281_03610 [Staphylococcus sp. HMSC73A05]